MLAFSIVKLFSIHQHNQCFTQDSVEGFINSFSLVDLLLQTMTHISLLIYDWVVSPMFDGKTFIHIARFVFYLGIPFSLLVECLTFDSNFHHWLFVRGYLSCVSYIWWIWKTYLVVCYFKLLSKNFKSWYVLDTFSCWLMRDPLMISFQWISSNLHCLIFSRNEI
jgi:hypothetical protein